MLALTRPIPLPTLPQITTRVATMDDLPFVDALQKRHSKQLGFFPRAQLEGYIRNGWMRIAEEVRGSEFVVRGEDPLRTTNHELRTSVGYIAFRDRYQKRDELGAVFQLCVEPGRQRGLIGATLLQSAFDAAAYGCRLFCCWCAQDLAANRFWEAMGFVPLAFRGGSTKKSRVHLFWQRRIRAGDDATPFWFPAKTDGGALREDRLVLPIPRGLRWDEPMPVLRAPGDATKALPAPRRAKPKATPPVRPSNVLPGGFWFAPPAPPTASPTPELPAAIERPKRERAKIDPQLIAASRELRDRWLEQVNTLPTPISGKYDVARQIEGDVVDGEVVTTKLLAA